MHLCRETPPVPFFSSFIIASKHIPDEEAILNHFYSKGSYPMVVERYRKEFCLPPNPKARHLRCYAHLDGDIAEVLPYLNTVLGGYQYYRDPPRLTLKFQAKLITLYPQMIAINMVDDEAEAEKILQWLKDEINNTWKNRKTIKPSFEVSPKPRVLDILKLLPKDNCQECGLPTCLVFAVQVSEGVRLYNDCPKLDQLSKSKLEEYLNPCTPTA